MYRIAQAIGRRVATAEAHDLSLRWPGALRRDAVDLHGHGLPARLRPGGGRASRQPPTVSRWDEPPSTTDPRNFQSQIVRIGSGAKLL
jgi:hypothetical protein